jgi:Phage tail protein
MSFPTTSAPSLSNYQLSFNGLTMGPGTAYGITDIQGLDLPAISSNDAQRPRDHGQFLGYNFYQGRDITVSGDINSDSTSLQHAIQAFATATVDQIATELPLWVQLPNLPALASMVRPIKRSVPIDINWVGGLAQMSVLFHASDPRLYAAPQSTTVGLGTPVGGIGFNVTFNASFGGGTTAGIATCVNAGNIDTRPTFTITGPCTNPTIYNATSGYSITLSNPSQTGYTVLAGDQVVIDTDLHSVNYYSGGISAGQPAARRFWIKAGSTWPNVVNGVNALGPGTNTIQFTSQDASAVAGTLTVNWASAYML